MTAYCESTEKFKKFLVRLWEHDLHHTDDGNTLIGLKKDQLKMGDESVAHLSQKILQGLDSVVTVLSRLAPEGKPISHFAESEVALLCAGLGLELGAAASVKGKFLARRSGAPTTADEGAPAKKCPAFDAASWNQNRCTGNACGLECLPLAL